MDFLILIQYNYNYKNQVLRRVNIPNPMVTKPISELNFSIGKYLTVSTANGTEVNAPIKRYNVMLSAKNDPPAKK